MDGVVHIHLVNRWSQLYTVSEHDGVTRWSHLLVNLLVNLIVKTTESLDKVTYIQLVNTQLADHGEGGQPPPYRGTSIM